MGYAETVAGMSERSIYDGKPSHTGYAPAVTAHARKAYRACERCGVKGRAGENLSMRGLCDACSATVVGDAAMQMANKSGPVYDKWAAAMRRAAASI